MQPCITSGSLVFHSSNSGVMGREAEWVLLQGKQLVICICCSSGSFPSRVMSRGYALVQAQGPASESSEAGRPITTYTIFISLSYLRLESQNYCWYLFPFVAFPSIGPRSRLPSGLALCPWACLGETMAFSTTSHSSLEKKFFGFYP